MNYYRELRVYGVNIAKRRNMIQFVTGVGCKGGCDFCAITAKYGNTRFVPFIQSGEEFLRLCEEGERRFNAVSFSIMDDNFPKNFPMIRDLLPLMEARGKTYRFFMFASADSLVKLGVDFLVRFGAETILMGVESMSHIYAKVKGIDVPALIADLRDNGIGITTSSILFMEHHTKDVLRQEIDWIMSLDTETHFIGVFTPYLGTCAYEDYVARGLIPATPDHRLFTGIDLAINHPHFTREEADAIQRATYVRKYREGGPAALARASTVIRGYRRARNGFREREREGQCWNPETLRYEKTENPRPDTYMKLRLEEMRNRARMTRPVLWTCWLYAPSPAVRAKARETMALYREEFGRISLKDTILSLGILTLATVESIKMKLKVWLGKDYGLLQPKPGRYTYPAGKRS